MARQAQRGRDSPRDFPESLSSMGRMVTGPQHYVGHYTAYCDVLLEVPSEADLAGSISVIA